MNETEDIKTDSESRDVWVKKVFVNAAVLRCKPGEKNVGSIF